MVILEKLTDSTPIQNFYATPSYKSNVHPVTCHSGTEEVQLHRILTTVDSGRWTTPGPWRFTPGKERQVEEAAWATVSVWTRMEERKFLIPTVVRCPGRAIHCESLYRLSYPGHPDLCSFLTAKEVKQCKKSNKGSVRRYGVTASECFCSHNSSGPRTLSSHQIMEDVTKTRGKTD
jgi:hypothetical protein